MLRSMSGPSPPWRRRALSSNSKWNFYPACPEPRREEHRDEGSLFSPPSSAYSAPLRYPFPRTSRSHAETLRLAFPVLARHFDPETLKLFDPGTLLLAFNETPLRANPPSAGSPSALFSPKDRGTDSLPQCPVLPASPCSVSRAAIHQSPRNLARPAPAFPFPAPAWDPSSPRQTKCKYFRSAESLRSPRPLHAGESLRSSRFLCESPSRCRSLPDRWRSRAS